MFKAIPIQKVLEVRYERGYRYLDRCGEAMLILQDLLPSETNAVWMPEDITPAGAKLKCPDLDLRLAFDATHFFIEQTTSEETPIFPAVASAAFAVISGRFDLRSIVRIGLRRFFLVGTDSTEEAEALSVKLSPFSNWPPGRPDGLAPRSNEMTASYENEDGSSGFNFVCKPVSKIEAQEQLDERAKLPSRLLEKGQKDALIEQRKRKARREKSPSSGLVIDIDFYSIRPSKLDIPAFWQTTVDAGDKMIAAFTSGK